MPKKPFQKVLTGIEVSGSNVNVAQIVREKTGWRLVSGQSVPFPGEVLSLSYQKENIVDPDLFADTVRKAVNGCSGRVSRIGLSIPNEIVKVSISTFDELPKSAKDVERMLAWSMEKSLRFAGADSKIAYHEVGDGRNHKKILLFSAVYREVIREYEKRLKSIRLQPAVIQPSGINQLNFYLRKMPQHGTNAFLGLYEDYFTFFVFEDAHLSFYHGVKKGFSDLHFFQDVDMTMQHYMNVNPEKEIEAIFVGSQVAFHRELEEVFRNLTDMDIEIIDETSLLETGVDRGDHQQQAWLSSIGSAIGAAQSLAV